MELVNKLKLLFKRKEPVEKTELEIELAKYPKKKRKHLLKLYQQYEKGMILMPGKDIDNKQHILNHS